MAGDALHTRLLQVLGLLYHRTPEEVRQIEADLLAVRKQAWREAIEEKALSYGQRVRANDPRHQDLAHLKNLCELDAKSIAATWQRDVDRHLRRLYEANPRGNRYYYIKHMEAWAAKRDVWKSRQIATQTVQTARAYAVERFLQENGMRGCKFRLIGPPPVCGVCIGHFAAGVVDQAYVDAHPAPMHIGCPHEWQEVPDDYPDLPLWVG